MCLYIDDFPEIFAHGERRASKPHTCGECGRTIDPGETYQYWSGVFEGDFIHEKMCAHCWGTIVLGSALTGCPRQWFWGAVHDLDPGEGFVGNILYDEGHDLPEADAARMLGTVEGRRAKWRYPDGALWPHPAEGSA